MNKYIVFFRGINVGGKHIIRMKNLREDLTGLGFHQVQTYIQSGNVYFESPIYEKGKIASAITSKVNDTYGFEPDIFVLNESEIKSAVDANPFPQANEFPSKVHLYFLKEVPANVDSKRLNDVQANNEEYELKGYIFYLFAPDGIGRSKLASSVEKFLGVSVTARNWRTVQKMKDMFC